MIDPVEQADAIQELPRPRLGIPPAVGADKSRDEDIFQDAALRQQVMVLKHKADVSVAKVG
jgi:hypothetical protein